MGRILPIELKEFAATGLDGTYKNLGAALSNPAVKVSFFNTSNVDAYISQDGSTDYLHLPAYSTLTLDESFLYKNGIDQEYYFPRSTQLTVTQVTAPGASGDIIAHIVTRIQP